MISGRGPVVSGQFNKIDETHEVNRNRGRENLKMPLTPKLIIACAIGTLAMSIAAQSNNNQSPPKEVRGYKVHRAEVELQKTADAIPTMPVRITTSICGRPKLSPGKCMRPTT